MENSDYTPRPSALRAFVRGFGTGAFNGALMMGIFTALTVSFGMATFAWAPILLATTATGLFTGLMAAKRALFDGPEAKHENPTYIPVPVQGLSGPTISPSIAPTPISDTAPEMSTPTRNWVAQTGRENDSQNRIQQILANGTQADRTSALLASREADQVAAPTRA